MKKCLYQNILLCSRLKNLSIKYKVFVLRDKMAYFKVQNGEGLTGMGDHMTLVTKILTVAVKQLLLA